MAKPQKKVKLDPLKNFYSVTLLQAVPLIIDVLKAGWVPNLISSPGVGKSSVIKYVAEKLNLCLIDVRLSQMAPEDLNGFPHMYEYTITLPDGTKKTVRKATYVPMDVFPVEGDPLPINPKTGKPYNGWLLFLDELPAAMPAVQVAAYKILLDKMVGNHNLHKRCVVASAGNLMSDKAFANRQSTATQSRIIHLAVRVDLESWQWWAAKNDQDMRVQSYMAWKGVDALHDFDPDHTDLTFPCPRTWEMVSDCIKSMPKLAEEKKPLIAGCIGVGAAREFYAYTEVYRGLPTFDDIVADPVGVSFAKDPSVQWALSGIVAENMTEKTAAPCVEFLERLGADFQVIALRNAIAREPLIFNVKAVRAWCRNNKDELIVRKW